MNIDEMRVQGDFDLAQLYVLHSREGHHLDVGEIGQTVRAGLKWGEIGESAGVLLCECDGECTDPDLCGRIFAKGVTFGVKKRTPDRRSIGKKQKLKMPWDDIVFELWVCDSCELLGTAATTDVWIGRMFDVPGRLLDRSYADELRWLRNCYSVFNEEGERVSAVSHGTPISVVLYRRAS